MTTAPLPPGRDESIEAAAAAAPAEESRRGWTSLPRRGRPVAVRVIRRAAAAHRAGSRSARHHGRCSPSCLANASLGWLGRADEADRPGEWRAPSSRSRCWLTICGSCIGRPGPVNGRPPAPAHGRAHPHGHMAAGRLARDCRCAPRACSRRTRSSACSWSCTGIVLSSRTPLIWAFGMAVTSAFWVCSATIALGLLFAEGAELHARRLPRQLGARRPLRDVGAGGALPGGLGLRHPGRRVALEALGLHDRGGAGPGDDLLRPVVLTRHRPHRPAGLDQCLASRRIRSAATTSLGRFGLVIRAENPTDAPDHQSSTAPTRCRWAIAAKRRMARRPSRAWHPSGLPEHRTRPATAQRRRSRSPAAPQRPPLARPPAPEPTGQAAQEPRRSNVENSCVLNYRDNHPGTNLSPERDHPGLLGAAFQQTLPPGILSRAAERRAAVLRPGLPGLARSRARAAAESSGSVARLYGPVSAVLRDRDRPGLAGTRAHPAAFLRGDPHHRAHALSDGRHPGVHVVRLRLRGPTRGGRRRRGRSPARGCGGRGLHGRLPRQLQALQARRVRSHHRPHRCLGPGDRRGGAWLACRRGGSPRRADLDALAFGHLRGAQRRDARATRRSRRRRWWASTRPWTSSSMTPAERGGRRPSPAAATGRRRGDGGMTAMISARRARRRRPARRRWPWPWRGSAAGSTANAVPVTSSPRHGGGPALRRWVHTAAACWRRGRRGRQGRPRWR